MANGDLGLRGGGRVIRGAEDADARDAVVNGPPPARGGPPVLGLGEHGNVRIMEQQRAGAPDLWRIGRDAGFGAIGPDEGALLNAQQIEIARQMNEEEIWGTGGLMDTLRGGINNEDQKAARSAIQGLLNSNDPFFDRMMRGIQDQYGLQSREALMAAANQMGARGRSLSGWQEALLRQQNRMGYSQAYNQNEMARYSAMQDARQQAAALFTGLSADMRQSLEQYAMYVTQFPHTTPSLEAFIFPPDIDDDNPVLGFEGEGGGEVPNPEAGAAAEEIAEADGLTQAEMIALSQWFANTHTCGPRGAVDGDGVNREGQRWVAGVGVIGGGHRPGTNQWVAC